VGSGASARALGFDRGWCPRRSRVQQLLLLLLLLRRLGPWGSPRDAIRGGGEGEEVGVSPPWAQRRPTLARPDAGEDATCRRAPIPLGLAGDARASEEEEGAT